MTKRLLFIDDELELWESALREELAPRGFEVKGEEDPSKALKVIASYKPDIVLLDILFPNGNLGKPTLKKIKDAYPALPVMMISSTMDKSEYKSEDYALADYRFFKAALAEGDFADLEFHLNRLIEAAKVKKAGTDQDAWYSRFETIVGKSEAMRNVILTVKKVADQDHMVLITGETGTGKEHIANAIHQLSKRKELNFVTVVCAALPKELLESELFGHEKGAFTGAHLQKKGKFEVVGDGTIFLDEIGEMPLDTQVKLLRFLQEKKFERVGGTRVLTSNARVIAASNRDLRDLIKERKFREDLYFRLNVVPVHIPPLRERMEDIPLFFKHFVGKANALSQKKVMPILRDDLLQAFNRYPWPGNIRELENRITRAVALADENILQLSNFPDLFEKGEPASPQMGVSETVDQIFEGTLAWPDLKAEFGARGSLRKEILNRIVERWIEQYQRRPSSEELANLLSVAPGNMRRILSESGLKLTILSK